MIINFGGNASPRPELLVLEQLATVARALGQPYRLLLLTILAQGERSVETLSGAAGLKLGNTSQHLQRLQRAGLVTSRKDGQRVFYRLSDEAVVGVLATLRQIAEHNLAQMSAIAEKYFRARDHLEPVSREELRRRIKNDTVTIIDVRPAEEFIAGHLPGAINVPTEELKRRLSKLPRDKEIVAYCRGPYCLMSYEAVEILRRRGFKAMRLQDGCPEWKAQGLPLETGNAP
jgi:rhodanese-related sulfurtransferase/DNA-binding HxlR family transcriptional regulator